MESGGQGQILIRELEMESRKWNQENGIGEMERLLKGMLSVTVIFIGNGIRKPKVKSWMRPLKSMLSVTVIVIGNGMLMFHFALMLLGKARIHLFSSQLWVNSSVDWFL